MPISAIFTEVEKIAQMTGERDRQLNQPVFNQTESRFGIFGTDLGSSFEHEGKLWFLFGDTWPSRARLTGIAGVSRYAEHMELFYFTEDGGIDGVPNFNNRWLNPFPLCGARFAGTARLAAVSRDPKHMEVFAIGEDGIIRGRWFWDTWRDWYVLHNARFSQKAGVAAVSRDPKHMEVFAVGEDGFLRGRWFWEDTWHDWYMLGNVRLSQTAGIAAVSRDPKHIEVFAVGEDGILRGRWFWGDTWHDWYPLSDVRFSQTAGIAAVSRDPKHMEVFAVGEDGKVRGCWFWEDRWHDWYILGEKEFRQDAGLTALSRAAGQMDVFGIGDEGVPWGAEFTNSAWFIDPEDKDKKTWRFALSLFDSIAWTTATEPGPHIPLNFISTPAPCARYISPQLRGLSLSQPVYPGAFSVPISGFSANGKMYLFYSEYDSKTIMARTYLALAEGGNPTTLKALYVTSNADDDPAKDGHFINIACKVVDAGHPGLGGGLPFSGPALLMWGSGRYRKSHIYLAVVPLAEVENRNAWLFYTGSASSPWDGEEHRAQPVVHGTVGELSVTWIDALQLWFLLYHGDTPIYGRVAPSPWGPWSEVEKVLDSGTVLGKFAHIANSNDQLSDPGRERDGGAVYGAYLIDRFTRPIDSSSIRFYFLISTWNPYNATLMTGVLKISRGGRFRFRSLVSKLFRYISRIRERLAASV